MSEEHEIDPTLEKEARNMGWVPQEEFRGDSSKWRPAQEFVDRGREMLPILRANNRKLEEDLQKTRSELQAANVGMEELRESVDELQTYYADNTKRAVAEAKRNLAKELREARDEGDTKREIEILDSLEELRTASKPEPKKEKQNNTKVADIVPQVHPDFEQWQRDNGWYGQDLEKTALADAYAAQLRNDPANKSLVGRAFFDKAAELAENRLNPPKRGGSKVEGDRGGSQRREASGDGGYSALSAEVRAYCESKVPKMVGPNKPFKTREEWQAHFASTYKGD